MNTRRRLNEHLGRVARHKRRLEGGAAAGNGCPSSTPMKCSDGTSCVMNADECPGNSGSGGSGGATPGPAPPPAEGGAAAGGGAAVGANGCPSSNPTKCADGSCKPNQAKCACPSATPMKCSDGSSCVMNADECPGNSGSGGSGGATPGGAAAGNGCPSSNPEKCADGSCKPTKSECACPSATPIKCSDGTSCMMNADECPGNSGSGGSGGAGGCTSAAPVSCGDGRCMMSRFDCDESAGTKSPRQTCEEKGRYFDSAGECYASKAAAVSDCEVNKAMWWDSTVSQCKQPLPPSEPTYEWSISGSLEVKGIASSSVTKAMNTAVVAAVTELTQVGSFVGKPKKCGADGSCETWATLSVALSGGRRALTAYSYHHRQLAGETVFTMDYVVVIGGTQMAETVVVNARKRASFLFENPTSLAAFLSRVVALDTSKGWKTSGLAPGNVVAFEPVASVGGEALVETRKLCGNFGNPNVIGQRCDYKWAPCGPGCEKKVEAQDEWAANAVAAPSAEAKAADTVLAADDPDAGKSFQQILLEKKTKGVGVDPFCFDFIREAYVLSADLGHYALPSNYGLCKFETLQKEKWLDYRTKQVKIQILMYNPYVDVYSRVVIKFDLSLGGRIFKWVTVESLQIRDMYKSTTDHIRLALECVFVLLLCYNWFSVYTELRIAFSRQQLCHYFRSPSNLINMLGQIMYFGNIVTWLAIVSKMGDWVIPTTQNYGDSYQSINHASDFFAELAGMFSFYKLLNSISIVMNILRLFIFMEFHDRMGLVTKTIGRVWTDMCKDFTIIVQTRNPTNHASFHIHTHTRSILLRTRSLTCFTALLTTTMDNHRPLPYHLHPQCRHVGVPWLESSRGRQSRLQRLLLDSADGFPNGRRRQP